MSRKYLKFFCINIFIILYTFINWEVDVKKNERIIYLWQEECLLSKNKKQKQKTKNGRVDIASIELGTVKFNVHRQPRFCIGTNQF